MCESFACQAMASSLFQPSDFKSALGNKNLLLICCVKPAVTLVCCVYLQVSNECIEAILETVRHMELDGDGVHLTDSQVRWHLKLGSI